MHRLGATKGLPAAPASPGFPSGSLLRAEGDCAEGQAVDTSAAPWLQAIVMDGHKLGPNVIFGCFWFARTSDMEYHFYAENVTRMVYM